MVVIMVRFRSGSGGGGGHAVLDLVEIQVQAGDRVGHIVLGRRDRLRLTAQVVVGVVDLAEFLDRVRQVGRQVADAAVVIGIDRSDLEGEVGLADASDCMIFHPGDADLAWEVAVVAGVRGQHIEVAGEDVADILSVGELHCDSPISAGVASPCRVASHAADMSTVHPVSYLSNQLLQQTNQIVGNKVASAAFTYVSGAEKFLSMCPDDTGHRVLVGFNP